MCGKLGISVMLGFALFATSGCATLTAWDWAEEKASPSQLVGIFPTRRAGEDQHALAIRYEDSTLFVPLDHRGKPMPPFAYQGGIPMPPSAYQGVELGDDFWQQVCAKQRAEIFRCTHLRDGAAAPAKCPPVDMVRCVGLAPGVEYEAIIYPRLDDDELVVIGYTLDSGRCIKLLTPAGAVADPEKNFIALVPVYCTRGPLPHLARNAVAIVVTPVTAAWDCVTMPFFLLYLRYGRFD